MTTAVIPISTVTSMIAIRTEGLTKRYATTVAVDGLDLEVASGQVYGFLGPNGAGKTTTIRMLTGLVAPSAGQGWVAGRSIRDCSALAAVGSMIEEPAFYPWMSGLQNLEVLRLTGAGASGDARAALERVGLAAVAHRRVRAYYQGMRQRLGLAAALLRRPPVLILDEPTNGLDPAGILEVRSLLRDLAGEGTTVFLSSHLLPEVEQVCDRAAVLVAGRLVDEGPIAILGGTQGYVRVSVRPDELHAALDLLRPWKVAVRDGKLSVAHATGREVNATLVSGGVIAEAVEPEQSVLEERFLTLVSREGDEDGFVRR
jgi:ABC-2 type transport system ATP-binding protein